MRYGWLLLACLALGCKDKGDPAGDAPASKGAAPASKAAGTSAAPGSKAAAPGSKATEAAPVKPQISAKVAPATGGDIPAATAGLSAAHTVAFFSIERPHEFIGQVDKMIAGMPAATRAEMPELLRDPAGRAKTLGFDPTTDAGWRSAGIDPTGGMGMAFDDRLETPLLFAKVIDRKAALAALTRLGAKPTLGAVTDGVAALTIDGETGLIGDRNGYTLMLPPDDAEKQRAAFAQVLKPDAALADDSTLKRAFSDGVSGLWISGYASAARAAAFIGKKEPGAHKIAQFYADRFEALSMSMGQSGGAFRLLASAKGVTALRQLFSPAGAVPAFAQHSTADFVTLRFDVNFAGFFDGLLALIPEEMAQPRSMVLMGKNAVPMAIGVSFDQLAQALTGHFAALLRATQKAGPPLPMVMAGVKDGKQLDAVLKSVTDVLKQRGNMPVAPGKVGGRDGYVLDGPIKFAAVRTDSLLFAGPLAEVEAAMARKAGLPADVAQGVDGLNVFGFFVHFDRLVESMQHGPDAAEVAQMVPAAKAAWGEHLTDGFLMSRWIVDGRGVQFGRGRSALALPGILAAVAIPAFVKYIRRSKTAEASMNVRKLFDGSVSYYTDEHVDATGKPQPSHFPATAPRTPATTACKDGESVKHMPDPKMWSHPTWQALNFEVSDPFYYQYEYVSDGKTFTARAIGDLDCDGVLSTFERVGKVDGENNVTGGAGLYRKNELE